MPYYSYTQTFSLSLLYCCCSYCASFCALLDGVCLSRNKRITYLLTYLHWRTYADLFYNLLYAIAMGQIETIQGGLVSKKAPEVSLLSSHTGAPPSMTRSCRSDHAAVRRRCRWAYSRRAPASRLRPSSRTWFRLRLFIGHRSEATVSWVRWMSKIISNFTSLPRSLRLLRLWRVCLWAQQTVWTISCISFISCTYSQKTFAF